ncbi:MAG: glycerol-3-phosphate dehydrogenase/oxidase [Bdellovibrionales bacterium]
MKEFSSQTRSENLQKLSEENFDLLIIGGGITGTGAARDAASRGLKVALIDGQDFASGASSRSSKLIHGGIRYLENYEFHLVFEALNERQRLFHIAPHLVHPLKFVLPLYEGDRVTPFLMGIGMWLYDALALFDVPMLHYFMGPRSTKREIPSLQTDGLKGSYVYSDAYMDDDRLVIETLRSAHQWGATAVNYTKAIGVEMQNGKVVAVDCRDEKTKNTFKIRAKHFISTVGPWTDILGQDLLKDWKKLLRPTKGIHLTFEQHRFPLKDAVVMSTRNDKRIVFGIPRHDMVIVGTTDTAYQEHPEKVSATREDVEYLLKIVNSYFPGAKLTTKDIVASYAGVRPLIDDGAETESKTSREHLIKSDPRNITFVAGGKYTTYRYMSQQTIDAALENFDHETRSRLQKSQTELPLNPAASTDNIWRSLREVDGLAQEYGLKPSSVEWLIRRHGYEAQNLLAIKTEQDPDLAIWQMEVIQAVRYTMCLHLLDFYVRRTPLMLSRRDHGMGLIDAIAQYFSQELGWSENQKRAEVESVKQFILTEYRWRTTKF